jgi:hypothetical protein
VPITIFGEEFTLHYVRSWDHEPSDPERELAGFERHDD